MEDRSILYRIVITITFIGLIFGYTHIKSRIDKRNFLEQNEQLNTENNYYLTVQEVLKEDPRQRNSLNIVNVLAGGDKPFVIAAYPLSGAKTSIEDIIKQGTKLHKKANTDSLLVIQGNSEYWFQIFLIE